MKKNGTAKEFLDSSVMEMRSNKSVWSAGVLYL